MGEELTLTFTDASFLSIQVYGLAIVISLLVAVVIRGVVGVLSRLEKKASMSGPAVGAIPVREGSGDHVAAIAAAIWATVGPHRIVHIEPAGRSQVWVAEGRFAHHGSHVVERQSRQPNLKPK